MVVMCPKDERELRHMLFSAARYERTMAIRYPRGEAWALRRRRPRRDTLGRWELLREGKDIALIGCGPVVYSCLDAAEELEEKTRSTAQWSTDGSSNRWTGRCLPDCAGPSGGLLTFEENTAIGGFGSGVMEALSEEGIVMPVKRTGLPDRFLRHSSQKALRQETGLDKDGIKKTVKHWLSSE